MSIEVPKEVLDAAILITDWARSNNIKAYKLYGIMERNDTTEDNSWESKACRKQSGWICSDCCGTSHHGMPHECPHNASGCKALLDRDHAKAQTIVTHRNYYAIDSRTLRELPARGVFVIAVHGTERPAIGSRVLIDGYWFELRRIECNDSQLSFIVAR